MQPCIECFHSRGQHLCKFIETKESVCIRKEFNSQRIGFGKPTWRPFHCFGTPIWPQLRHVKTLYGPCVAMFKVPTQLTITWLIDGKDVHYYVKTDCICLGHLASNACSLQENNVRLISSQSVRTMYCSHTIKRMTYIFPNSHPEKGAPDLKEICIHKRNQHILHHRVFMSFQEAQHFGISVTAPRNINMSDSKVSQILYYTPLPLSNKHLSSLRSIPFQGKKFNTPIPFFLRKPVSLLIMILYQRN